MVRKLIGSLVVGGLILGAVFGRDAGSYLRTGAQRLQKSVTHEIPVEFELDRARDLVKHLLPEIRRSMHVVAEQQVEVERLAATLASRSEELDTQKHTIFRLKEHLEQGSAHIRLAGVNYTPREVEHDLAKRFERYRVAEETRNHEQALLDAKSKMLAANQDKLRDMLSQKKELELQLARLEARLNSVQAVEAVQGIAVDDSQLQRARDLIASLDRELDVRERLLAAEGEFSDLLPVGEADELATPVNVMADIDAYFAPADSAAARTEAETDHEGQVSHDADSDAQLTAAAAGRSR